MTLNTTPVWHFNEGFEKIELPDPRIAIAKHINWTRPAYGKDVGKFTDWSIPEPDNLSAALFANKPIECEFLTSQVWYRDTKRNAWFSVYYLDKDTKLEWLRWTMNKPFIARWTVFKSSQLRRNRALLEEKKRQSKYEELSLNQRLAQMNFYTGLLSKTEESAKGSVLQRIGET